MKLGCAAIPSAKEQTPDLISKPAEPEVQERRGCYVYCITSADAVIAIDDLQGVERAAIEPVEANGLQALVSAVPLNVFQAQALRERFEDSGWVEQNVRAHDQVLRAASLAGAVVPFRFCTVLRSKADARRLLATHESRLKELLESLDGKREWGVKFVFAAKTDEGKPASGRDYLLKKRATNARPSSDPKAQEKAAQIDAQLIAIANDAVLLAAREEDSIVLNGAYLLDREAEKHFDAALADAAEGALACGLLCEVTGPWPPYSFVKLDLPLSAQKEPAAPHDPAKKK
jgi:hypothetical protein